MPRLRTQLALARPPPSRAPERPAYFEAFDPADERTRRLGSGRRGGWAPAPGHGEVPVAAGPETTTSVAKGDSPRVGRGVRMVVWVEKRA
jgi:hypothetical protein